MGKCFQIHPQDNTAVLLEDAAAGAEIEIVGGAGTIVLRQEIEYGHKVALADIPAGAAIVKYGIDIGHSTSQDQISVLHIGYECQEPVVIGCAVLLIHLEGDRIERIEGIHAHATLKTGAGELT